MATTMTRTEHNVSREDGNIYYYKVGQGEPLIMLHNVGRSGWIWRNVIGHLAPHFTCYNIDMPGFDHSDVPPQKYSVGDYTKAVLDVMDSAGIEQRRLASNLLYCGGPTIIRAAERLRAIREGIG